MLSQTTRELANQEAQSSLLDVFAKLNRVSFDASELSPEIKPAFDVVRDLAYQYAHAYCRQGGQPKKIGKIAIDYYADSVFNACASEDGENYVIAISAGVPTLLLAVFFDVFRSTNPFAIEYEDVEYESPEPGDYRFPRRLVHAEKPTSKAITDLIESTLRDSIPDSRWQRVWSITMAELATFFVFAHEIGHLVRGHTAILGRTRQATLLEVGFSGRRRLRPLLQAWETEADETAFAMLWNYVLVSPSNRQRLMKRFRCAREANPELALAARAVYAVSFVFFLLGQAELDVDAHGTHPSGLVRVTYVIAFVESALEAIYPKLDPELIDREIKKAHEQANAAWDRLGLTFGDNQYRMTIDNLPLTASRMERRRSWSQRLLTPYRWRKPEKISKPGTKG